jgi:hypothetical protein
MIDFKAKMAEYGPKVWPFLIVFLVGGGVGYGMHPSERIVETERLVQVVKEDKRVDELLNQMDKLNKDYQEMKNSQTHEKYHKEHTETRNTDGTVVIKDTIDKNVDSVVQETKHEVEVRVVEVEKQVVVTQTVTVEKEVFKEKIVEPVQAQWHLGVLAGLQPQFKPLAVGPFSFGVEVERRIIGPVFVGIWGTANTGFQNMQVGAKISVEF